MTDDIRLWVTITTTDDTRWLMKISYRMEIPLVYVLMYVLRVDVRVVLQIATSDSVFIYPLSFSSYPYVINIHT